jgi:hypothetical protein
MSTQSLLALAQTGARLTLPELRRLAVYEWVLLGGFDCQPGHQRPWLRAK